MKSISLKIYPDPVLRAYCEPITDFDSILHDLIDEMKIVMLKHQGIGLAAPQVGINKRLFLMQQVSGKITVVINPTFYFYSIEEVDLDEACLSLPNYISRISRKYQLHFTGYNQIGNRETWRMSGLDARVVQHEVDHLNGKLICDYKDSTEKNISVSKSRNSFLIPAILKDLKEHIPFTAFGAIMGILIMVILHIIQPPSSFSETMFWMLHPCHVFLSAQVTSGIYLKHEKQSILKTFLIGYFGAIGIGTLSDSIIPYLGELMLNLPNRGVHLGFIEKWWLVNPLAVGGVLVSFKQIHTKFPHAAHVLISTWASLFHMEMALGIGVGIGTYTTITLFLFLSVWIPCCTSDIVFPLFFVKMKSSEI